MNPIEETIRLISGFNHKESATLENCLEFSKRLREACRKIERSWSGSYAGWHGRMYFRDFDIPSVNEMFNGEWGGIHGIPDGWEEKQPEAVQAKIDELVGDNFSSANYEENVQKLRKDAKEVRDEIILIFSSFQFDSSTTKEQEILQNVEEFKFGEKKEKYIRGQVPGSIMTRDSEALRQGICIPSWLYYDGVAFEGREVCESIAEFTKLMRRLIRQLKAKTHQTSDHNADDKENMEKLHPEIYKKCYKLYEKGIYPEAAEKGFKVVRDRLRKLTGHETGSEAFGKGKLYIHGAAAANVDEDFNQAVKFLTMAIDRFRNEKSHTSDGNIDDPVRAFEYLSLSSLAMNLLDNSEIKK